jgi:hypothetical protein
MKIFFALLILLSIVTPAQAMEPQPTAYGTVVDQSGNITLPPNYRSQWSHIGSWLIADPKAPGHGFHDVYMQPGAVKRYRKTGEFPDGAVIVKEVRKIEDGIKTTGQAQWAGDINIWFVMVKDNKGRFNDNPHWSEGWGWALFENSDSEMKVPEINVSKGFTPSCQGCHTPAKDKDWVFIEGYPTLKSLP